MKIEVNNADSIGSELLKLRKEVRNTVEQTLDIEIDKGIDQLKARLLDYVNSRVTEKVPDPTKPSGEADVPKSKVDLIKEIFNVDVSKSDVNKVSSRGNTLDDNCNIFIMKQGRIKAWQSVNDSSTFSAQENYFRNRLGDGIIYDVSKNKFYKVTAMAGIKLECSRETGQTIDSEKKFEAYKNSTNITRRKLGPDQRVAVWTIRKEDVYFMIKNAIDVDGIVNNVIEGKFDAALSEMKAKDYASLYTKAIENIQNIKAGKISNPGTKAFFNIQDIVKNIKATKRIADYKTTYTLVTNYSKSLDSNQKGLLEDSEDAFMSVLKKEIFTWKIENEEYWVNAINKSVNDLIKRYSKG